jgi:glutamate racemase
MPCIVKPHECSARFTLQEKMMSQVNMHLFYWNALQANQPLANKIQAAVAGTPLAGKEARLMMANSLSTDRQSPFATAKQMLQSNAVTGYSQLPYLKPPSSRPNDAQIFSLIDKALADLKQNPPSVIERLRARELAEQGLTPTQMIQAMSRLNPAQGKVFRIAAFDSSNGGVIAADTMARYLKARGVPGEVVVMLDHANAPYGKKDPQTLIMLVGNALTTADKLNFDLIAMACNTACTAFPQALRGVNTPVVDLINVTSKAIIERGDPRPVVIATPTTIETNAYPERVASLSGGQVQITGIPAEKWAPIVNDLKHLDTAPPQVKQEVLNAVQQVVNEIPPGTTSIWLGCTHYPSLRPYIEAALKARAAALNDPSIARIPIIDPMEYQAQAVMDLLRGKQPTYPQTGNTVVTTTGSGPRVERALPGLIGTEPGGLGSTNVIVSEQSFKPGKPLQQTLRAIQSGTRPDFTLSQTDQLLTNMPTRGIRQFHAVGGTQQLAAGLRNVDRVLLLTGFNVPVLNNDGSYRGVPETDGPAGTVAVARALALTGKQVTIGTDVMNKPVVEASLNALGITNVEVVAWGSGPVDARQQAQAWLNQYKPQAVMAIELPGRNEAGNRVNMRGIGIDLFNPPLDEVLIAANERGIRTFGVGDGGNEAGMGNVRQYVPQGTNASGLPVNITSNVGATAVATGWNSNLAALHIAAEILSNARRLDMLLTPEQYMAAVRASVDAGAVDGVDKAPGVVSVDGYPMREHLDDLELLNILVRQAAAKQRR